MINSLKRRNAVFTIKSENLEKSSLQELKDMYNISLNEDVICIASISLWYGDVTGYEKLRNNLNSIFSIKTDTLYVDARGNVRGVLNHHNYLFREWKTGLTKKQKENFLKKVSNSELMQSDITRYTKKLGDLVNGCNYRLN